MSRPVLNRIVRRETHSPRTVAMVIAVVLLIAALVLIAVELVLDLAGQSALLATPKAIADWIAGLPDAQPSWVVVAGGIVVGAFGLVFLLLAVTPGRLSKHRMVWGERAVVVDNGVIAAALAQHLSDETGISRDDITVGVSHRTVDVTLRPGVGVPLDAAPVRELARAEISDYSLSPRVKTRVRVVRPNESEPG